VAEQFIKNPTSPLISVWLDPYHFNDKILIMGDAAHAVTPFFGQGANSCFEDCEILDELLEKHGDDITTVFKEFSRIRVASAHALTDLCIAHGKELGKDTDSAYWLFKRKIGRTLHSIAPNQWIPFMTMVAFTRIPYDEAVKKKKQMENILDAGVGVAGLFSLLGLIYGAKAIGSSL
jgi:kynurenine 3-monooxygenase